MLCRLVFHFKLFCYPYNTVYVFCKFNKWNRQTVFVVCDYKTAFFFHMISTNEIFKRCLCFAISTNEIAKQHFSFAILTNKMSKQHFSFGKWASSASIRGTMDLFYYPDRTSGINCLLWDKSVSPVGGNASAFAGSCEMCPVGCNQGVYKKGRRNAYLAYWNTVNCKFWNETRNRFYLRGRGLKPLKHHNCWLNGRFTCSVFHSYFLLLI